MAGFIISIAYTIYYKVYGYWFISYLYIRILLFFTNNIALHRYFAHKSFKTGIKRHIFLAWLTVLAGSSSPFAWAIQHRHHHLYADTKNDLHSPLVNKWKSMFGTWAIMPMSFWIKKEVKTIPEDLYRDTTVMFIHKNYYKIWSLIFLIAFILGGWEFCLFYVLAPVGWNLFHGSLNNYFNHLKIPGSYRNYDTDDNSQNHKLINIFLLGEGLHNNHHAEAWNYNQAHRIDEFDLGAWITRRLFVLKDSIN